MDLLSRVNWRWATLADDELIFKALLNLDRYSDKYDWAVGKDFGKACNSIADAIAAGNVAIVDGYLVCVDTVIPWYSNATVLQEWLVLKLEEGGNLASIPIALQEIAIGRGASLIMSADSSPVNIVAGAYKAAAFKPLTTSFYKVV
jgi:hypothetical protein